MVDDDGEFVWLLTAREVLELERLPRAVHDGNPYLRGAPLAHFVGITELSIPMWLRAYGSAASQREPCNRP